MAKVQLFCDNSKINDEKIAIINQQIIQIISSQKFTTGDISKNERLIIFV